MGLCYPHFWCQLLSTDNAVAALNAIGNAHGIKIIKISGEVSLETPVFDLAGGRPDICQCHRLFEMAEGGDISTGEWTVVPAPAGAPVCN